MAYFLNQTLTLFVISYDINSCIRIYFQKD